MDAEKLLEKVLEQETVTKEDLAEVIESKQLSKFLRKYPIYVSRVKQTTKFKMLNKIIIALAELFNENSQYRDTIAKSLVHPEVKNRLGMFFKFLKPWHHTYVLTRVLGDNKFKKQILDSIIKRKKQLIEKAKQKIDSDQNEILIELPIGTDDVAMMNDIFMSFDPIDFKYNGAEYEISFQEIHPYEDKTMVVFTVSTEEDFDKLFDM